MTQLPPHLQLIVARPENKRFVVSKTRKKQKQPLHLRLIPTQAETTGTDTQSLGQQMVLPSLGSTKLYFINVYALARHAFSQLIRQYVPQWTVDARVVPRFDILTGNRRYAFDLFTEVNTTYIDLYGRLDIKSSKSAELNPVFWGPSFLNLLDQSNKPKNGPFFFLFDDKEMINYASQILPEILRSVVGNDLFVAKLPAVDHSLTIS